MGVSKRLHTFFDDGDESCWYRDLGIAIAILKVNYFAIALMGKLEGEERSEREMEDASRRVKLIARKRSPAERGK